MRNNLKVIKILLALTVIMLLLVTVTPLFLIAAMLLVTGIGFAARGRILQTARSFSAYKNPAPLRGPPLR